MSAWQVAAGVGLDLVLGDPRWLPHPIRGFGWLAGQLERLWRASRLPLRLAGAAFTFTAVSLACLTVSLTLPWAAVFWIWVLLALRSLDQEAALAVRALGAGNLDEARRLTGRIVGRDTGDLDEEGILRAVIETVAENLSDAVVAPLFYLALGGPLAMAAYKSVNTLDSIVGYRNERYKDFGWASARLDDALNLIPSRLSAALVWVSALLLGYDARRSVTITIRDAAKQPSPNSGYPEGAFAGALGIRLGGTNHYGGVPTIKAFLGDPIHAITKAQFVRTRRILYCASALMVASVVGVRM